MRAAFSIHGLDNCRKLFRESSRRPSRLYYRLPDPFPIRIRGRRRPRNGNIAHDRRLFNGRCERDHHPPYRFNVFSKQWNRRQSSEKGEQHRESGRGTYRKPLFYLSPTDRAIGGKNSAVAALKVSHTKISFANPQEVLGVVSRHPGKVVNIQLTLAAMTLTLVALHRVPIRRARACDLDIVQRTVESWHMNSVNLSRRDADVY